MLVSALVLTTRGAPELESLGQQLSGDSRIDLGAARGFHLPLVTRTRTLSEARNLAEKLRRHPGVIDLQLVTWMDEAALDEAVMASEEPRQEPA